MVTVAIVTSTNVGVPDGVAPLNSAGVVAPERGGTGLTALPTGALHAAGNALAGGTLPVIYGGTGTTASTGSGEVVLATSPILSAPVIQGGTINGTSIGDTIAVSVNASSIVTQSLSVGGITTGGVTGTGNMVLANSPTLVTPNLGTPSTINLANATGLDLTSGVAGILPVGSGGTGVATLTGLVKGNGASAMTAAVAGVDYVDPSVLGVADGVATLGATGKLTASQIPDSLLGGLNYQGTWNAATNTPTLVPSTGTKGHYYKVSVAGTTDLDGLNNWNIGDLAIYDGVTWGKVDGVEDQVLSVNGMTGAVTITRNLLGAAAAGSNADITALTGLTTALSVAQGGTGVTTSTGTGSVVLSDSPVLVTPNLGTPSAVDLANAINLPLSTGVTGVLPITSGGTGAATQQAALNSLAGAATAGYFLRGDGTNVTMAQIQAADVPTLNQNTTGTAASVTNASQPSITSVGTLTSLTVAGSVNLSGATAPLELGGVPGTVGQFLTSAGPGATPTWTSFSAGTVTSVDVSGGTTGLTFSGGPVTSSGTITLSGTLAVASGGTGTTTSTGTGNVVLSASPTFTGTVTASALTVNGQLALGAAAPMSLNGSQGTAGQVLTSAGAGATPTWETVTGTGSVTSVEVSGGTTGLTTTGGPITGAGTITLAGTLVASNGGTGFSSYNVGDLLYAATTSTLAKLADVATGNVLISGGVGVAPSYGKVDLTTHVTGTLPVANGGTGVTTSTGTGNVVLSASPTFTGTVSTANITTTGTFTLAGVASPLVLNSSVGTAGQVLTSAGAGATPTWTTVTDTGTVTSVEVSGGTTGLTTSGGPVTTTGTITLAGTLAVANGGTGVTTSTGTGSVVLSDSPTFTGTVATANLSTTGTLSLQGLTSPVMLNGTPGTAGQMLTSAGPGATPTWTTVSGTGSVTSVDVSGGTTGLSFSGGPITTSGTITLAGTLSAANGGTGVTSYAIGDLLYASGATTLSKLADVATGNVLISGGVGVAPAYGKVGLTTHVSGTLPVANGGTGVTTSTGTGSAVLSASPTFTGTVSTANLTVVGSLTLSGTMSPVLLDGVSGAAGQVLTSAGADATPTWTTPTTGTVTSVEMSGGTTGLTFSGGPITTSGTLTMSGTLAVANGGTGTNTSTGAGAVVLSESPTLAGIISMADTQITGSVTLVGTTSPLILNTSAGTAGQVLTSAGAGATPTWANPIGMPTGGTAGQVLTKNSGTNFDAAWATLNGASVGLSNVDNTSDATKNSAAATLTNKTFSFGANTVTMTLAQLNTSITDSDVTPATSSSGSSVVATGTTAQRDGTPQAGYFRFNTTLAKFEGYNGTTWGLIGGSGGAVGGGSDDVFYENSNTVTTDYTITAGKNAMTAGPVAVNPGVVVTVPSGSVWTVV